MGHNNSPHDHIATVVAAHGALTTAVADASRLMSANARGEYAAHLEHHRSELNVAIGELALWLASFGDWGEVDVQTGIAAPATVPAVTATPHSSFDAELLALRELLKKRRARLLSELADARTALHRAGLPADEITAYRRVIRLWAGEAIDVVAAVHRLTLADRYIPRLARLTADDVRPEGAELLRQWMEDLEAVDRDGELALAESCGYGDLVEWYRAEAV